MDDVVKKIRVELFKALADTELEIDQSRGEIKFYVESLGYVSVELDQVEESLKLIDNG